MDIVIVSDSHGNKKAIDYIFNNYKFDHFIYLGDGVEDLGTYQYLPNVHIVRGNCDFFDSHPLELNLEFEGVKILATHGHKYMVKYTKSALAKEAIEQNVQVALFGHTHKFCDEFCDGVRLINPGSLKQNNTNSGSFIMLQIKKDELGLKHIIL